MDTAAVRKKTFFKKGRHKAGEQASFVKSDDGCNGSCRDQPNHHHHHHHDHYNEDGRRKRRRRRRSGRSGSTDDDDRG